MTKLHVITRSPQETIAVGQAIAHLCKGGEIICLNGDLGAGKTTLVKGIAKGLKLNDKHVNSPTFVIMNAYEGKLPLYHFDFYRLEDPHEIAAIGYDEFLYGQGVAVIEWAQRFGELMPPEFVQIDLVSTGDESRKITISGVGKHYESMVHQLSREQGFKD